MPLRRRIREKPEPTIALINIVFLMLIFFLVAGTLARPMDGDLTLVRTAELDQTAPPDALVIHADGRMSYQGTAIASPEDFLALHPRDEGDEGLTLRLVPDRDLAAQDLVRIGAALRAGGAERVMIVTERGLE